jgi:spermidine synthase
VSLQPPKRRVYFIYVLFALSGISGLIYESVWARYLKFLLGHAAYGQILTLVIFMGGMGVGAFLGGKYVRVLKNPFYLYALIELAIGLGGLIYHPLFQGLNHWIYQLGPFVKDWPGGIQTCKLAAAILITAPWAILLGMTFPILAVGMMALTKDQGKNSLPWLYFSNSFGGAVGILWASFVLIPALGTPGTLTIAGSLNIILALFFYLGVGNLNFATKIESEFLTHTTEIKTELDIKRHDNPNLLLIVSLGTGLSSFIYEICWVRLLSLVMGSSTHSFDLMISAFILGLAAGGLCSYWLLNTKQNKYLLLGGIQIAMGLCAGLSICGYEQLFNWMNNSHTLLNHTETAYAWFSTFKYGLAISLMFPASFFAGMTLPFITFLLIESTSKEKFVGYVYGFNTLGAIIGTLLASLVLIPWLQLKPTLLSGALLDIALGFAIWFNVGLGIGAQGLALIGTLAALSPAFFLQLNAFTLSKGVFRNTGQSNNAKQIQTAIRHGRTATISFQNNGVRRSLKTNGKTDASLDEVFQWHAFSDEITQIALAAYPMTLMRSKYQAAMIGFGSGMTAHYLLGDPLLEQLDQIEIEKEVVNLARGFLPYNRRAYESPKQRLIYADARNFFSGQAKTYDLIISEPSNPWVSGVSGLFTQEFYKDLKRYLKPQGLLVQWMHAYEFDSKLLLSILKALKTQFPYLTVLGLPSPEAGTVSSGDLIILASEQPYKIPFGHQQRPLPVLDTDLKRLKLQAQHFDKSQEIFTASTLAPLMARYHANSDYFPTVDNQAELDMFTGSQIDLLEIFLNTPVYYQMIFEPEFHEIIQTRLSKAAPSLSLMLAKLDYLLAAPPEIQPPQNNYRSFKAITDRFLPILDFRIPVMAKYRAYLEQTPNPAWRIYEFDLLKAHRMQAPKQSLQALKRLSEVSPQELEPTTLRLMMFEALQHKNLELYQDLLKRQIAQNPHMLEIEKEYLASLLPSAQPQ